LTQRAGDGYGARPMLARSHRLAVFAVLAAAACTPVERPPAPLDRFTFPTGLTLADGHLLVVSSNFDLTYEDDKGGTVMSIDTDASIAGSMAVTSAVRIPSFGGEIAVARKAACPALASDQALVPNRLSGELFRLGLGADGGLSCGADCRIPITDPGEGDPFAVEVVCRNDTAKAYVGWLRTRTGSACSASSASTTCGVISEIPLEPGGADPVNGTVLVNSGGIRKLAYRDDLGLLFFLSTGSRVGWIDLSGGCEIASSDTSCPAQSVELGSLVVGAEVRSIGFSSPGLPLRLYVTAKLFDPVAAASGVQNDVGGVLMVLSLRPASTGGYDARLLRTVPLGTGATELEVIPRAGKRDLVVVSVTDDGEVWFWDDEIGAVTGVIGRDEKGRPRAGTQPYGLAFEDLGTGVRPIRLYVGSFGDAVVSVWEVNPDDPDPLATYTDGTHGAELVKRIGE